MLDSASNRTGPTPLGIPHAGRLGALEALPPRGFELGRSSPTHDTGRRTEPSMVTAALVVLVVLGVVMALAGPRVKR